jgi:threonyl-tRNA synthetase
MLDHDDHRALCQRLELLHFQEEAPGMAFWHPRGLALYRLLEGAVRAEFDAQGYAEVKTPQLLRRPVWEASGHWEHFAESMFRIDDQAVEAALKPVSCPGHIAIAQRGVLSYRDLPRRFAEFGVVHRDELGGALHGLLRLRQFTQDDGHIFCDEAQAGPEIERFCRSVRPFYKAFGFDEVSVALSTRPEHRVGDDALWDVAESALAGALDRLGERYDVQAGGGAFYGPKIEFVLRDRRGQRWQCGTIQYDLAMPRRFDLRYVDPAGERRHVVMLHRALYGSLERFLGIVLEHHGARLPGWLAPTQLVVLPVSAEHAPWAREVEAAVRGAGLRVAVDERRESLARRIAEAHEGAAPFLAAVGGREASARSITLRVPGGAQQTLPLDEALARLVRSCARPSFGALG